MPCAFSTCYPAPTLPHVRESPPYIHQQLGLIPSCHSPTLPFLSSCHAVLSLGVLKCFLTLRETTSLSLLTLLIV